MVRKTLLVSCLILSACGTTTTTTTNTSITTPTVKKPAPSGMNVKKVVLDNGLTVLIAPNPKLPIASYYTLYDVGGRYEVKGTTGATHFLEHMMFKGAKKYGPGEFDTLIEKNGGVTNAYTTSDATVYYQNIPAAFVTTMVDLEADRIQNLLLEPFSFESERKVIFEERKMRYENSPDGFLYLMMMKKIFEGTPYGQSVIGDVDDLTALNRDQMMEFFKTYYTPDNAVLAIAGDVDPDKIIAIIKEKYGNIPRSKGLMELKAKSDAPAKYDSKAKFKTEYKFYSTNPNPKFMLAYRGEKLGTRRAFIMDVLAYMLGNGGSSYLTQKYVKSDKPLFSEISLGSYNLRHAGVFYFSAEVMEGVSFDDAKVKFMAEIKNFCQEGIDAHSLTKTKNQIVVQAYHQLKTNAGVASTIMMNEKLYGDYNFGIKEMEIYQSITEPEVRTACNEILNHSDNILISVWNKHPKNVETK
jgi:zinc protease